MRSERELREYTVVPELESRVIEFIKEKDLLKDTRHVCVATSGGADSMVLLTMLNKFKGLFGVSVSAIHVNHGIRGESADRDERFVDTFCRANGIEVISYSAIRSGIEVPVNASEEWARTIRYNFINKEMKRQGWTGVRTATAHTKSDQAETFIGNVYHGSGLNGMGGIPVRRGKIIRPVLCLNRAEIEYLADAYGLEYMTDETNLTDDYRRNKIRHHILPSFNVLGDERPEEYLSEACDKIAEAYDFIKQYGDYMYQKMFDNEHMCVDLNKLRKQHSVIRTYIFGKVLGACNSKKLLLKLEQEYNNAVGFIRDDKERQVSVVVISDEKKLVFTNKGIYIRRNEESVTPVRIVLKKGDKVRVADHDINKNTENRTDSYAEENMKPNCRAEHRLTDCIRVMCDMVSPEEIGEHLGLKRNMVTTEEKLKQAKAILADRTYGNNEFKPMDRKAKKIKHLVNETGICLPDRQNIPLIFDENGNAIWMCGLGFTDEYAATEREIADGVGLIRVYVK